jgi:hypothetical protein
MMKKIISTILGITIFLTLNLFGQEYPNCFLDDFELTTAEIPTSVSAVKPADPATVTVTLEGDTLGKISKYVFGNAIAVWVGSRQTDKRIIDNTKLLDPSLIRFPGGSWSDIFFWDGIPADIPDSLYDGTTYNGATATKTLFYPQSGKGSWPTTTDQYYEFIDQVGTEGLITINYAYARYGLSDDPVAQAAHLAAEWVRYDDGRTKFWEIGNENAGPWEAGWFIDTKANKDGQPQIITGELYGKHFKVFVDSMKAAAEEIDAEIFIGGQVLHYNGTSSWNIADRKWNEGFFREAGDAADFYVMHNYFGKDANAKNLLSVAATEPAKNISFIQQDIANKNGFPKPVAITEYNMNSNSANQTMGQSFINGMQGTILICELIKNNFGLGARWLLVTGENGMFYDGSNTDYLYHPRPDFYYLRYLQKFYGDHAISTASSDRDILSYASKYSSGETGVVIVNKGDSEEVISLDTKSFGVGQNYYIYSFIGGTDNGDFSRNVYINGYGPSTNHWGPFDELSDIPADSYPIGNEIKLTSPGKSVQMIMIEGGNNIVSVNDESKADIPDSYKLFQNYPNPFNPSTRIGYRLPIDSHVTLKVYDVLGKEIKTLLNERQNAGNHSVQFNASNLPSGVYFYKIEAGEYHATRKLVLFK